MLNLASAMGSLWLLLRRQRSTGFLRWSLLPSRSTMVISRVPTGIAWRLFDLNAAPANLAVEGVYVVDNKIRCRADLAVTGILRQGITRRASDVRTRGTRARIGVPNQR